jgi:hypothetical protein
MYVECQCAEDGGEEEERRRQQRPGEAEEFHDEKLEIRSFDEDVVIGVRSLTRNCRPCIYSKPTTTTTISLNENSRGAST